MTCHVENAQFDLAMELLIENGFNGIADPRLVESLNVILGRARLR